MSQPNTTSQKPKPDSTAEKNLSRWMYLPRRIPSMSETATFTLPISDLRIFSTTSALPRVSALVFRDAVFLTIGAARGDREIVGKGWRGEPGRLGRIVPAAHAHGVRGMGLRHEGFGLALREDPALQREA